MYTEEEIDILVAEGTEALETVARDATMRFLQYSGQKRCPVLTDIEAIMAWTPQTDEVRVMSDMGL